MVTFKKLKVIMLLTTHGLVPSFIGQKPALQIIPLATIMHFSGTIGRVKMNLIAMSICVLTILVTVSTEFSFQKYIINWYFINLIAFRLF